MSVRSPERRAAPSRPPAVADLIGGRVLAWAGGAAIVVGITLFFLMAVSRGWLDHESRVLLGGAGSLGLLAAGVRLHGRGRTEASLVAIGAAIVGMFTTLIVGSGVYHVIAPVIAIVGAFGVGAIGAAIAIRWAATPVAWLGLIGALVSPFLLGTQETTLTIGLLFAAAGAAMATAAWRDWPWLAVTAGAVCIPQWALWTGSEHPLALILAVVGGFALLGFAAGLAISARSGPEQPAPGMILIGLNALVTGTIGWFALNAHADLAAALWLTGLGAAHVIAAVLARTTPATPGSGPRRLHVPLPVHGLCLTVGAILADVTFSLNAGGVLLVIGWGASAVGLGLLRRYAAGSRRHPDLLLAGLGTQLTLLLMRAILQAPPGQIGSPGFGGFDAAIAIAALAAACLICGQLTDDERGFGIAALINAIALLALAYLPVVTVHGAGLAMAWAGEGATLAGAARIVSPRSYLPTRMAGLTLLSLGAVHATVIEAPPTSLVFGAGSLRVAAESVGAVIAGLVVAARSAAPDSRERTWLSASTAVTGLYLVSVAIITAFKPGKEIAAALDLSATRQQGQVLLSVCWSVIGLGGLIVGLRRGQAAVRNAALGLLLLAVAKVFLYDLASLDSIYRVASFVGLGLLLLISAFAYQRLRPPPAPDLRTVPRPLR